MWQEILSKRSEMLTRNFSKFLINTRNLVFSGGALSIKTKNFIAMAIDATHGAVGGVVSLAQRAMKLGATKEEVVEALRVAYYIGGRWGPIRFSACPLDDFPDK